MNTDSSINHPGPRLLIQGGIGAGKSTVREILSDLGWETVDADQLSRLVLTPTGEGYAAVSRRWPQLITSDGINRTKLAEIVFGDPRQLAWLESVVHPPVLRALNNQHKELGPKPLAIELSVASLDATQSLPDAKLLVVEAPQHIRQSRLRQRGMTAADMAARMQAQPPASFWRERADVVLDNSTNRAHLVEQINQALAALFPAN